MSYRRSKLSRLWLHPGARFRTQTGVIAVLIWLGSQLAHSQPEQNSVTKPIPQTATTAAATRTFQQRLGMVKREQDYPFKSQKLDHLKYDAKRDITAEERQPYLYPDTAPWKTFEDDWVRFEYPDHPLITVEVTHFTPDEHTRVRAQAPNQAPGQQTITPTGRSYHLTVGKDHLYYAFWQVITPAKDFDETVCRCGPLHFERCMFEDDGTALRFSLLASGNVKKAQAMRDGRLAVLAEWTHTYLPQSIYARIGRSMRLKSSSPARTRQQWLDHIKQTSGPYALISWLDPGTPAETVRELIGKPDREEPDGWIYIIPGSHPNGYRFQMQSKLRIKDGAYLGVDSDWQGFEELPAVPGTTAWAEQLLKKLNRDTPPEVLAKAEREDFPAIVEAFVKAAPTADEDAWLFWSSVIKTTAGLGWRDPRVPPVIISRFRDKKAFHAISHEILEHYQTPERAQLFTQRLKELKALTNEDISYEINVLQPWLPKEPAPLREWVDLLIANPNDPVRYQGYIAALGLPRTQAIEVFQQGLHRKDDPMNQYQITLLLKDKFPLKPEDVPWLQEALNDIQNEGMKIYLQKVINSAKTGNPVE